MSLKGNDRQKMLEESRDETICKKEKIKEMVGVKEQGVGVGVSGVDHLGSTVPQQSSKCIKPNNQYLIDTWKS